MWTLCTEDNKMITGLIGIKFQENATDEEIQELVSNFYGENNKIIEGMQYLEFRDPKTLDRVNEFLLKDDAQDSVQRTLEVAPTK